MINLIKIKPSNLLNKYIECYWHYTLPLEQNHLYDPFFVPEGVNEIIFDLGEGFNFSFDNKIWHKRPDCFIGGLFNTSYFIKPIGKVRLLGARFKPSMFRHFSPVPLNELTNKKISLPDTYGAVARQLKESIHAAKSPSELKGLLDNFFLKALEKNAKSNIWIDHLTETISKYQYSITVKELADYYGVSDRHLRRVFLSEVGVNPKNYFQIKRLYSMLKNFDEYKETNLAKLAIDFGFYDQAHLCKELKSITNISPSILFKEYENIFQRPFMD